MVTLSVTAILRCIPSFGNHNFDVMRLLAISERLCYSAPRKWAASPLRFLEACRIREHWGTHGGPLRQGALRGTSPAAAVAATSPALGQGAPGGCSPSPHPSGEARRRSQRRFKTSSLKPSGPVTDRYACYASVTDRYGSVTPLLRLCYGLLRLVTPLLRLHAYGRRRRRKNSNGYNQRTSLSLRAGVRRALPQRRQRVPHPGNQVA